MLAARIAHVERLLSQLARPGGVYPVLALATRVPEDERASVDLLLAGSVVAPVWREFGDPLRTVLDRATELARFDARHAVPHFVAADLWVRRDDARHEPFPELRAQIARRRPEFGAAYDALLARLVEDFDRESEAYVHRRGFAYAADQASGLFVDPDERLCFARACVGWGTRPAFVERVLPAAELAELAVQHVRGGASAELRADLFTALACADVLTTLRLWGRGISPALRTIGRASNLTTLALRGTELDGTPAEGAALASLPLESLDLASDAAAACPVPPWIATLSGLRSLSLGFAVKGVDDAAVDLAYARFDLPALATLRLSGVGRLPSAIGRLVELRSLTIRGRHLEALPASLTELARLDSLSIDPVLALPELPEGFERLRGLRTLRLGHLARPKVPEVLFAMPWLRRIELISGRVIAAADEAALRRALPDTRISIALTGNAR